MRRRGRKENEGKDENILLSSLFSPLSHFPFRIIPPLYFNVHVESNIAVPQKLHSVQRIKSNKQKKGGYWFPCGVNNHPFFYLIMV